MSLRNFVQTKNKTKPNIKQRKYQFSSSMNSRLLGEQSHLKLSYRVFLLHEFHMRSCFFLKWVSSQHPIGTNPKWILSAVSVKDCLIQRKNLTASCTVVEVDTYLVADGAHGLWESECEGGSAWPPCSGHPKTIATSTVADQYHTAVTQQLLVTSKYTITEATKKKKQKKHTRKLKTKQTNLLVTVHSQIAVSLCSI